MPQKMKALVKSRPEPGLWLEEVPVPEIGINDVLIRVHRASICGTDLHILKWDAWASRTIHVPMVIGHEFEGEVAAVGSNVVDFFPGQVVSAEGHVVCGRCRNCLAGRRHLCASSRGVGVHRPGCFAEYIAVPMSNVWAHHPDVDREVACIFDPFGNAVHTALSFPVLGEDVLITGAGPIGLMAAAVVRHAGARFVVITDVNPWRLELARTMRVTMAVDPRETRLKDVQRQVPQAICDLVPANASTNLLVNREAPPFDNPDLRRALALALDRKSFIDILAEGQGDIGGAMLPPPAGVWGMPADVLATIPGYGPDVARNRSEARAIMARLGYGPDKRLAIKVAARNIPNYRDPAIILIDQLKEIWIDGELDAVETANWFPKVARKDDQIGLNNTGSGVDDPDQQFFENYSCGSERNYTGYCNADLEKLFVEQSTTTDRDKRRRLVWEIDKKLQEDGARPILYHSRLVTCMQPQLKGLTIMVNSSFNGWRMEDVWLDP